jgi:hypothetical protein
MHRVRPGFFGRDDRWDPVLATKEGGFGTDLEEKENGPCSGSSLGPKCCPVAF